METERLIFNFYTEKDKADFISLFTDAAVMEHVGDGVLTREQAEAFWLKLFEKLYPQNYKIWAIFAKEDSRYVGHAGVYPRLRRKEDWEFVYFLNQKSWGKGYATEIARRIIEFAFEDLSLRETFATVDDDHSSSIHVLEKVGMKFERFEFDEDGRFSVYSIRKNGTNYFLLFLFVSFVLFVAKTSS
ncbi:MAG: GNAT family N-acetyltransferase [Acidobacteria bacterium]|nr:GNAT family N-acetyltransferase [Acidobacteriota bacterium]